MDRIIKIGTRDSQLAIWQAEQVKNKIEENGRLCELVYIKSDGDIDLVTPLYEMGVQGVFTKALDAALLSRRIDIAVHSMKDVPTMPAEGLTIAAVLPRANYKDIVVLKDPASWPMGKEEEAVLTIATGSVRRKAQWLNRYPQHRIENLRGNVNTRLRKLTENPWDGAIFAAAGLERLGMIPPGPLKGGKEEHTYTSERLNSMELDWMLPAPAQGIICIACREEDAEINDLCDIINDPNTFLCASIEREFLRTLMGGCSTPIAALALVEGDDVIFNGKIFSLDGIQSKEITRTEPVCSANYLGITAAQEILENGADRIVAEIRNGSSNL